MPLHDDLVNQKMASYIETVGRISVPSIFINTSTFLKLKEKVDEKTGVLLVGPKGCGKSVTLVRTFLYLLKGNHNTFYLSSKILESLHNPHVQQYNAKMFDDYFKETSTSAGSLTCLKSYEQIFTNYIKMHRKNTRSHLYLFIDFCQFKYINAAVLNTMLNLSVESWGNVSVIAALSSGEGLFGDNEQFREDITNFIDRFRQ